MGRMLYAVLICSDEECAQEFEAWGDAGDFEKLACECGCTLQAIAFCEAQPATIPPPAPVIDLRRLKSAA
jgi:hypothetical protein